MPLDDLCCLSKFGWVAASCCTEVLHSRTSLQDDARQTSGSTTNKSHGSVSEELRLLGYKKFAKLGSLAGKDNRYLAWHGETGKPEGYTTVSNCVVSPNAIVSHMRPFCAVPVVCRSKPPKPTTQQPSRPVLAGRRWGAQPRRDSGFKSGIRIAFIRARASLYLKKNDRTFRSRCCAELCRPRPSLSRAGPLL